MHPPVRKPVTPHPEQRLAATLAKHFLSPSRFENAAHYDKAATQDGLRCLSTLDKPTRLSLPLIAEPATPHATPPREASPVHSNAPSAPSTPSTPVAAPSIAPAEESLASRFGSEKPEYKAALRDHSVVEALLDYHTRLRPAITGSAGILGFRPAQPRVVAPKLKPGMTRIFRPRGD